tara:strand:- start:158 stop:454 length:297 start_codon:yes stop_codon:yes gene_type:complete
MQLKDLAKEPKLIKITLDDADVVKEFGEAVEFWTWDRQPMATYLKMANITPENTTEIFETIRELVLDADGAQILDDKNALPTMLLLKVLNTVVETLGK